jgi:hypothetical protein
VSTIGRSHPIFWHFSFSCVSGLLYPTGKSGGGLAGASGSVVVVGSSFFLDELPALPLRTTLTGRRLGAMGRDSMLYTLSAVGGMENHDSRNGRDKTEREIGLNKVCLILLMFWKVGDRRRTGLVHFVRHADRPSACVTCVTPCPSCICSIPVEIQLGSIQLDSMHLRHGYLSMESVAMPYMSLLVENRNPLAH